MGGEVFLRPAWADAPKEYKKGGKVKKAKKAKSDRISQNVKVNVKIGDSVMLRKGNVPVAKNNPGEAKRLFSQGSVFGGGLPRPLQSMTYMSAPPVAAPLSRMDFIGSADAYYSRNRNKHDDIPIEVNPAGIKADITPSKRMVQNNKAVETPDAGLALARALQKTQDLLNAPLSSSTPFQGDVPRIGGANLTPSGRALPSQPSTGFMNTKASMIGANVGGASSSSEGLDDYPYQDQDELPGMGKQEAAQPAVSAKKPRISLSKEYDVGSEERERQNKLWSKQEAKRLYPTKQALTAGGYKSLREAEDDIYSRIAKGMKRGGRVHSAF